VNREKIPEFSRLTAEEVDYRLDRMLDLEFLERKTIQYEGVQLTFEGYDALALHTLAERETVDGFGAPLGVGKESDVYEVQSYRPMALKFHREGYTQFRRSTAAATTPATRSTRPGSTPPGRPPNGSTTPWRPLPDVNVPRPVDQNRHAIVMEKMTGRSCRRRNRACYRPAASSTLILREVAAAYDAGYVHADVSEYNVAVSEDGIVLLRLAAGDANRPRERPRTARPRRGEHRRLLPAEVSRRRARGGPDGCRGRSGCRRACSIEDY